MPPERSPTPAAGETPARAVAPQPPLYKQAMLTFVGIYPLIMLFMALFGRVIQPLPLWLNNLIVCLVLVPLLTFGVMPLLNKLFSRWLRA